MTVKTAALALAAAVITACGGDSPTGPPTTYIPIPLTDLGTSQYGEFQGGLYPGGANEPPAAHAAEGRERARLIRPLDAAGAPAANGRIVFLAVGMSNTSQEFCGGDTYTGCAEWSFAARAGAEPQVDPAITFVNGARGGAATSAWQSPTSPEYTRIRDQGLAPLGLTEAQVQVIWLKLANANPGTALPFLSADAYALTNGLADVARALHQRYPNLRQVYVSSRSTGAYAQITLNPEPFAYQTGFSVKWLIESQIRQMSGQPPVPNVNVGSLDYDTSAPWLAWGPYLWAQDINSIRSDGFYYERADFEADGTHPSPIGEQKIANLMLHFFFNAPTAKCWFLTALTC